VRTEAITGGPQRLAALMDVGDGDESWLGPSWSNGRLYFYKDSLGAGFVVYRFGPASDTYMSARAHTYLTGFAAIGERAYETTAAGDPRAGDTCPEDEGEPCAVRLSEPRSRSNPPELQYTCPETFQAVRRSNGTRSERSTRLQSVLCKRLGAGEG
jgi:hypothetical protein